jgi:hypothetical protein
VADEAGSHTGPDAAGGEAGHGPAKLDPVIHRYVCYREDEKWQWQSFSWQQALLHHASVLWPSLCLGRPQRPATVHFSLL